MPFNTSTTRKNTLPPDAEKRQVCNMTRWLRNEVQAALSAASRCTWHRPKKMPSLVPPKRETSVGHKSAQEGVPSSATKVPATGPLGGHSSAHTASVLIDSHSVLHNGEPIGGPHTKTYWPWIRGRAGLGKARKPMRCSHLNCEQTLNACKK